MSVKSGISLKEAGGNGKKGNVSVNAKQYVLDTNVLIHDPQSILKFEDNDVVIPMIVIEELDKLKKGESEVAYSARQALKLLDSLREKGNIAEGIRLDSGGTVRVEKSRASGSTPDNEIIDVAYQLDRLNGASDSRRENGNRPAILVSKDTSVRIKGEAMGLLVQDYLNDKTSIFKQYGRVLSESDYSNGIRSVRYRLSGEELYRMVGEGDSESDGTRVKRGKILEGFGPKNIEQEAAIDALTNPEIEIVALTGAAGTGKTLLAICAGIHQTTKKQPLYEQMIVARPIVPMGNDLGYLPGTLDEKLVPWSQPIFDAMECIIKTPKGQRKDNYAAEYPSYQYLIDSGKLQIEALTYIRGRSLPDRYFIVDEAQNLTKNTMKTIITRCGEGTKIVFTGDIFQIDSPYLDSMSNGLSYMISRFINEDNFAYINLKESVRSRIAEQGASLL